MQILKCTVEDVLKLAILNKQLIDDEKSDNPMTINEFICVSFLLIGDIENKNMGPWLFRCY